ncbi:MAG: iron complex outermembrane receptor protein, partial [Colwellia sp.]
TGEFTLSNVKHQLLIGANSLDYYYGQLKVNGESINYSANQEEPTRPDISYKTDDSLYTSAYDYYGIYIQDLMTLNDQWQVSVGGRYDKQSKENANNESLLPKAGLLFHPDEQTTFYASYSEGFEPQRSEKLENDRDINNGMKLDAMTSEQMEIGAKWQLFDERLLLTAALFDITKTGKLITEAINDNPTFETRTEQAGEQRHKGFEAAAQGAINDKLFVMASVMKLDAQYDKDENYQGKTPIDAPQWSASIWSRYEFNDQLAVNIGAFYEGERFADSNNTIKKDAYTRIDVGATYKTVISNSILTILVVVVFRT